MAYNSHYFGSTAHMIFSLLVLVTTFNVVLSNGGGLPLGITFDPPADRVKLDASLTVRCELTTVNQDTDMSVSVADGISMLLHCPISPWGSFCFQNCKSACVGEKPGKCPFENNLGNVSCQTIVTQEGHVKYEYTIPRLTKEWLTRRDSGDPGFYCRSAGLKTPEVWLTLSQEPPAKSVMASPNPPTTPAPQNETKFSVLKPTLFQASATPVKKTDPAISEKFLIPRSDFEARNAAIFREILVVGAIIVVFISVMLNVFCCTRYALIRQYSKTKGPVHMQHLFCMAEEIRNARLVRHARSNRVSNMAITDQWDQAKSEVSRLPHSIHDGSFVSGSRILVGNPVLSIDGYHHNGMLHGSDLLVSPNCGGMVIGGGAATFSDTNSNTTAGVDVHTRCLPDGRAGNLPSESAFSLVGSSGVNAVNVGSDRRSKTSSMLMLPGQQLLQVWGGHPGHKQLITSVPAGYYLHQPSHVELATSQNMGSDGLGSCLGSLGQPDPSILENYQRSSSGISTLQRTGSSNKEQHIISAEHDNRCPQSNGFMHLHNQQKQHQQLQHQQQQQQQHKQQQAELVATGGQHSDTNGQFPVQALLMLNRCQQMGSSQPQLAATDHVTHLNNSNSNPQLRQNFTPVYALVGTSVSQLDSGTGSGSGQLLLSGDNSHSGSSGPKVVSAQTSPQPNFGAMSNGSVKEDADMKVVSQDRATNNLNTSYNRRRMQLMRNYGRRKARLKHRTDDVNASTEDDLSDWSESVLDNGLKTDRFIFNNRMSGSSSLTEYAPATNIASLTNETNLNIHENTGETAS